MRNLIALQIFYTILVISLVQAEQVTWELKGRIESGFGPFNTDEEYTLLLIFDSRAVDRDPDDLKGKYSYEKLQVRFGEHEISCDGGSLYFEANPNQNRIGIGVMKGSAVFPEYNGHFPEFMVFNFLHMRPPPPPPKMLAQGYVPPIFHSVLENDDLELIPKLRNFNAFMGDVLYAKGGNRPQTLAFGRPEHFKVTKWTRERVIPRRHLPPKRKGRLYEVVIYDEWLLKKPKPVQRLHQQPFSIPPVWPYPPLKLERDPKHENQDVKKTTPSEG